jgi:hypothetical protein
MELDIIGQEHDHLQRDLDQKSPEHPVLDWIDQWERDSINQIQQAAELARIRFRQLDECRNDILKMSFNRITQELRSARQTNNYSEIDLTEWTKTLREFRGKLDTPLAIRAINDDNIPSIHLIKVIQAGAMTSLDDQEQESTTECFQMISGPISLSEQDRVATYAGNILSGYGSVRSLKQYSSNTHVLRFRLESKSNNTVFLGIVSVLEPSIPLTYTSPSACGWRDINFTVNKGVSNDNCNKKEGQAFQAGDEMTLTLECDSRRLIFVHKRTMICDTLAIDLQTCPLPWQIAVSIVGLNDCVRILQ